MASIFGHAMASTALGLTFFEKTATRSVLLVAAVSAILPDADILAFKFGLPYLHPFGHRGATHSIVFAVVWGWLAAFLFFRNESNFRRIMLFLMLATLSHPILDAMTDGGRGVALFFPFSNERIFLPWRPIQVSPLSPSDFRGEWAWAVLRSEFLWIGLPCLAVYFFKTFIKKAGTFFE